jgi:hypothetical protein
MVLGLLSAVAACPAIIGTTEAVRQGQKSNAREKHRGRKVNLIIRLPNKNEYSPRFDESLIVLKDGKVSAGGSMDAGSRCLGVGGVCRRDLEGYTGGMRYIVQRR